MGQRVHQRYPCLRVVEVAHRLARRGVVIVARQHHPQLRLQLGVGDPQQSRIADRTKVSVSIVATAS